MTEGGLLVLLDGWIALGVFNASKAPPHGARGVEMLRGEIGRWRCTTL